MSVDKRQLIAFLTFRLANQHYALPIMNVLEVAPMMTMASIPQAREVVAGMVNRHGEALPVLDLRIAFNLPVNPPDETTLFIVAQSDKYRVGLITDEVVQVKYIDPSMIQESNGTSSYISHITGDGRLLYQQINLKPLLETYLTDIRS